MRNLDNDHPTLSERCFAAVFSGLAAGITYAVWLLLHGGRWGAEQVEALKEIGQWVVLAGAVVGFLGGISWVASLWGGIWDRSSQPIVSLRTAVVLLVLGSIAYGVFKHLPQ